MVIPRSYEIDHFMYNTLRKGEIGGADLTAQAGRREQIRGRVVLPTPIVLLSWLAVMETFYGNAFCHMDGLIFYVGVDSPPFR